MIHTSELVRGSYSDVLRTGQKLPPCLFIYPLGLCHDIHIYGFYQITPFKTILYPPRKEGLILSLPPSL